jgi:hypothetical protein
MLLTNCLCHKITSATLALLLVSCHRIGANAPLPMRMSSAGYPEPTARSTSPNDSLRIAISRKLFDMNGGVLSIKALTVDKETSGLLNWGPFHMWGNFACASVVFEKPSSNLSAGREIGPRRVFVILDHTRSIPETVIPDTGISHVGSTLCKNVGVETW